MQEPDQAQAQAHGQEQGPCWEQMLHSHTNGSVAAVMMNDRQFKTIETNDEVGCRPTWLDPGQNIVPSTQHNRLLRMYRVHFV